MKIQPSVPPHLPLDRATLRTDPDSSADTAVRDIVKAVRFRTVTDPDGINLLGADTVYHSSDPELDANARALFGITDREVIRDHRESRLSFDLCLDDVWSGAFLAAAIAHLPGSTDVVLVHVDDHTDMMPTLLVRDNSVLVDPTTGSNFDAGSAADWESTVAGGAVSIGNFVTAFAHVRHNVHVRHLCNSSVLEEIVESLELGFIRYPLIPGIEFAALKRGAPHSGKSGGSFAQSTDPARTTKEMPHGVVIVHIDLDYFVNDFDGDAGRLPVNLGKVSRRRILDKMDALFIALRHAARAVTRWIVATSPGFCASRHWEWLLDAIEVRIRVLGIETDSSQYVSSNQAGPAR